MDIKYFLYIIFLSQSSICDIFYIHENAKVSSFGLIFSNQCNRVKCAEYCLEMDNCKALSYVMTTKECGLYNQTTSDLVDNEMWTYMTKGTGFMYQKGNYNNSYGTDIYLSIFIINLVIIS